MNRPCKASEEDLCGKFIQHLDTCLQISEADRVLCHLIMKEMCVFPKPAVVFHFAAVELWNY